MPTGRRLDGSLAAAVILLPIITLSSERGRQRTHLGVKTPADLAPVKERRLDGMGMSPLDKDDFIDAVERVKKRMKAEENGDGSAIGVDGRVGRFGTFTVHSTACHPFGVRTPHL